MTVDTLRPLTWSEYVGQDDLKSRLSIHVAAALTDHRMPEHMLFVAGAGYGKTSLAEIMATQLQENLEMVTMPITSTALATIVRSFEGILFLDEIHRASTRQQEELLPLLEFGYVQSPGCRRVEAGDLTIIAATTEPNKVIKTLRDRFPIQPRFADYTLEQLADILRGMGEKLGYNMPQATCLQLVEAADGAPRRCRRFAMAYRDLISAGLSDEPTAEAILDLCGVDADGLLPDHVQYLRTIADFGGSKGLQVMISALQMTRDEVLEIERVLIRRGMLELGNSRELTKTGFQRLKLATEGAR